MANSVRKNTVKLVFGPGSKVPSHLEVLKFSLGNLKLSAADIHSIYKDENGGQFYVKVIDEPTFSAFIADSDESYSFNYDDGSVTEVQVDQACRIFRYVRIFNLPPEIEDREIQYVLGQYGTIRQHVRERFPSEVNVNIFTGVRGVHMEVSREIPAHLYVGHFRARIFYDGLKNKCFYCKSEGHEKSNCPKLAAAAARGGNSGTSTSKPSSSSPLGRPAKPVIDTSAPSAAVMTTLASRHSKSKCENNDNGNNNGTLLPPRSEESVSTSDTTTADESNKVASVSKAVHGAGQVEDMEDLTSERDRAMYKRPMIISSEGSDSDETQVKTQNECEGTQSKSEVLPKTVSTSGKHGGKSKRNKK